MRKLAFFLFLFVLVVDPGLAEETTEGVSLEPGGLLPMLSDRNMLLLSLSAEDYPVTPGDIYELTYFSAGNVVSHELIVESDFTVNLNTLGKIDAEDLVFPEFKALVEKRISQAYPDSTPSTTILSNGRFQVYIKGEVMQADYATAWGLSRLSQIVGGRLTPYSSIRDIQIISRDGVKREYDLFKAKRFGDREQDPYLKPGDTVMVSKRDREIRISGQVKRPGKYQLLPAEGLEDLVEYYGDGFTELANLSRIRVDRLVTKNDKIAESFTLDLSKGYKGETILMDLDTVYVPEKTENLPVLYIEGAVSEGIESTKSEVVSTGKVTIHFKEGDTLYDILWASRSLLHPEADLQSCFVGRGNRGEVIPVNLERLLYEYTPSEDLEIKPYDHVIIPFRQFFVSVTGAVAKPGAYPYVPEKTYRYYLNLAGGVDPDRGTPNRVVINDGGNNPVGKSSILEPESRVYVPYSFSYYFIKYLPVITSSVSAILSIMIAADVFQ